MENILYFPKRLLNSWRGRNVGLALLVITLNAETVSKGNCVNNRYVEAGGECCTNFYPSNGECIACPAGSYGDNCSTTCPSPSYGENCGHQCHCSSWEECSPFKGCVKITTSKH
ncbi:platelet endothelial aggregation receptor 1-like [Saccostrea cucullata]|uniref:platelet endothelial aggregation receptor 1-like n=1 Tax=Saccostrea cuccullata TaxID=36930 RepID=UPI002ED68196